MRTSRRSAAFSRFLLAKTAGSRLLMLLAIAAISLAPSPAVLQAAFFNWTGPGGNSFDPTSGNWNVAANWSGGLPPINDPSTLLDFGGTSATPYTSTHNLGVMQISGLSFSSSAPVTHTINASGGSSLRLVSDPFFEPTITQNGSGGFVVNVPMELAANVTYTAQAGFSTPGQLHLGGNLTGAGNFTSNSGSPLIFSGDNSGYSGNIVIVPPSGLDTATRSLAVISARSPNALGTGNLHLLGATGQTLMPAFATGVLEIGADLDGAGNATDFSRAVGDGPGQINMTGPDEKAAFGFAALGAVRTVNLGGNAVPTTLANKQPFLPFGDGDGYSFGSPTADNTLAFMNPIDFLDNANRNLRTMRGVGNVPEGRMLGSLLNSANNNTYNISGNGGVILDNVSDNSWQQGSVPNPVLVSGGIYLAVSDPATANANSPLGRNGNTITIGSDTGGNSGFGLPLGSINTGVMTYGPGTSGASPTPIIDVARNFEIGAGGSGIMTVGGFTADHTRFSGGIDLNGVNTRFSARTGGRVEFSGVVSDVGTLTVGDTIIEGDATTPGINVEGRGVVVLSGDNTYTGSTEVTHGTLLVNNAAGSGTGTGPVNVHSGAALGGTGTITPTDAFGTVTINSGGIVAPHTTPNGTSALTIGANGLVLNSGALLNFNIGAPGVSDVVNLTGVNNNLTISGSATLNLSNVGGLTVATYPIVTHVGGGVQGGGTISIGTNPGLGFNYAVVQSAGQVELRVTSSAPSRTWTGGASNEWSTTAANWSPSNYADGNQVVFDNTGNAANSTINITAPVSPAFITVDNGGAVPTYTLGGAAITGGTGINKTGSGALVLSGANTFSGVTSITGGTLRVTNTSGSATGSGLVAIAGGATLSGSGTISPTGVNTVIIGDGSRIAPHLTPTTANTLSIGSNGLTLRDGSILDFNFGAVGNHDRVVLTGAGNTLTLDGDITLNVNTLAGFGTGTYPVLEFGALAGNGNLVLGTLPAGDLVFNLVNDSTNIALAVAATKTWNGAVNATWDTATANWTLGGSGAAFANGDAVRFNDTYTGPNRNINVASPVTAASITASNSTGNDYTIGGASIAGPGGVTKSGTGTLTINNLNTFTGKTAITGGTLSIASAASLGAEPSEPTADAITIDGATLRTTGSALFNANRGVTLGAGGATFNVADADDVMSIPGTVLGVAPVTVSGEGTLQLGSINNTFAGLTVNDATLEAVAPIGQNVVINANGTAGILGDSNVPIVIDGGTLKLTTTESAQNITLDRLIQFGPDGGTVDIRNTLGGTLGGAVTNGIGGGVGNMRVDLTNTVAPVVVQWNGGESGLSTNNPANGDWSEGNNNLEWQAVTTGAQAPPLRIELSHAAMTSIRTAQFGTYNGPFTIRGGAGGDVTAAGNEVTEIGRVQVSGPADQNVFTFSGGMFLEGSLQFNLANSFRVFDNDITLRGDASGHPADITFNGRATGTAFAGTQQTFQLTLGTVDSPNTRTLLIENGATANFDVRIRTDQANSNGVEVTSKLDIKAGGTARARQSWLGLAVGATDRPVGYVEVYGDIVGNGNSADGESVFEVQMPFSDRNQPRTSEGGVTFRGGSASQFEARLVVNGDNSGAGAGLVLRGAPRDTKLYTVNNQQGAAALAFPTDPVTSVAKLSGNPDSIASATRLAALTGSGGYLTLAAVNETFPFPAGGEWAANVPVGLKVINSNTNVNGDDVSISGGFQHNINVDAGARLNAAGATLGPAAASPNLGLIKGLGTIVGGPVFNTGATVAPGFGMGTLSTAGAATINGTLQAEINGTQHDQLNSFGNLVLGGSSTLNLPAGNVYDGSKAYILAAYTGTRTGNFGSTTPLPAGYTLDYGTGTNSYITLRPANPVNEWFRTDASTWHTGGNWLTGAVPNSNADTARLGTAMLSDGVIDLGGTNTTVKTLSFQNGAASYNVGATGGGRLTLESNSGNASIVFETGNANDHFISAGLTLASDVDISVNQGRTLFLLGQHNWGGRSVTVNSGRVRYSPTETASNTAGATLTVAAAAEVVLAGTAPATSDGTNHVDVVNHGQLSVIGPLSVGSGTHAVSGLSGTGATTVGGFGDISPPATLIADHVRQASLAIGNNGLVTTAAGGGTSVIGSLTIAGIPAAPDGKFDLNDNAAILNYTGDSPIDATRDLILAGRGGVGFNAPWDGLGITSSAAAAAEEFSRSIGYAENAALPLGAYSDFRGQPVDDTSVLMAFTRTGDANLDGIVNDDDVTIVGATYAPGVPQPSWALGDFDYNGFVDDDDVTLLGVFYNPTATPLNPPAEPGASRGAGASAVAGASAIAASGARGDLVAAVPEPSTLILLIMVFAAVGVAATIRRGRRSVLG